MRRARSMQDERYMHQALALAARAKGATLPNPMVGALVVHRGRIVGRGFHRRAGEKHAEWLALEQAGQRARGATLYVTLEPCAHTGRTPPCVEAILRSGIARVVAAMRDPNPLNRGRGLRRLRRRGVRTRVGVLAEEAAALNEIFVTRMRKNRPFVTVKIAQSLDGKIATAAGHSRWISGSVARRWVQRLRAQADAILVGVDTVLRDNPRLTVRGRGRGKLKQPIRIVLDSKLRTPPQARLFASKAPVWIATVEGASRKAQGQLERAGAQILRMPARAGRVVFSRLMKRLAEREISHLLIEGGAEVIASAFQARAVDRLAWVIAPKIIGGRLAPGPVGGRGVRALNRAVPVESVKVTPLGGDLLITGRVRFLHRL